MKYLIMTEGAAEKAIFDALLDRNLLKFDRTEILSEKVNKCRNIKERGFIHTDILSLPKDEEIIIIRVMDKYTPFAKLPKNIAKRPISHEIILTKPEIEILHIIADGCIDHYLQHNSGTKPSVYLLRNNKDYEKSELYWKSFLSNINDSKLISILKVYEIKRKHTHQTNEFSFYDYLKDPESYIEE